jgi:uracil-DNA glycosylase
MDHWIHESWRPVVTPHSELVTSLLARCEDDTLPPRSDVFRALQVPLPDVRVAIVGQDPYPTPGHAHGLAFSVPAGVHPLPKSLSNIFTELESDLGGRPASGDLTPWAQQGVLLLNRVLTVRSGHPASHRGRGWEVFTEAVLRATSPIVAVLWGNDALTARPFFGAAEILASPHPSPLSAHRGFFGSRPFSRINAALLAKGEQPITWF